MSKQTGIALVSSILLLLTLTLVAVSLADRSRLTVQMAAAGVAREEANQQVNGIQEEFIDQQRQLSGSSAFVVTPSTNTGPNQVNFLAETGCRRSRNATSSGVIVCRQSELISTAVFGRNDRGSLSVISGIEQPVLQSLGN
ncbi:pilus assembly protein PilX [Ferrimonas lipolytica]|uniref:Pilus assembly protein PilX n=1 Tax=Ferrimonas lipolytica TaxID=2724191 RepID=A0A6H1U903_9GAMM|nr:pilus assembly protein PilX [Ferrimonas lipolytica]QIZ75504.1 pilus assembly protein PilX [Ferrimonas lipolytica]